MNQHHTPCATLISTVGLNLTLQHLVRQGGTEREEGGGMKILNTTEVHDSQQVTIKLWQSFSTDRSNANVTDLCELLVY